MSLQSKPRTLSTAHGPLEFGPRTLVMGILNVTPDSFSDGGEYLDPAAAVARALAIQRDGADLIDIGGESTRPGAAPVAPDEQIRRVVPVIRDARREGLVIPLSIDTRSAKVAAAAMEAGADIVNDVSALRGDPDMIRTIRGWNVPFIVMHMQGTPATMQDNPSYRDVVREIVEFFAERERTFAASGLDTSRMMVDPGLGFGKLMEHNVEILRRITELRGDWPLLVGASRKAFVGRLINRDDVKDRLGGSLAVVGHCALAGVEMVRVHDVRETRAVVDVCSKLRISTD